MINRVVLVGRLTRDPELRKTNNGTPVASFTVAVDNWTKNQEGQRTASFIPVVVWNEQANNVCKYVHQGSLVGVDGKLSQRTYQKQDGTKVSVIEIIADSVRFLEPKGTKGDDINQVPAENKETDAKQESTKDQLVGVDSADEDVPF